MKKIICFVIAMMMLSTQVLAATYYDVNVEGLTYSEKEDLIEWLDDENMKYDVESYSSSSSNTSNSKDKKLEVEKLSYSQKDTLVSWLKNRDYNYSTKSKNGYYYVTIEYTSSTKSTLINYLENKNFDYDTSSSKSSDRTGKAYLVANGYLWYVDGDEIKKVDSIYLPEYVLFTKDGGIAYINSSKRGMYIEDMDEPTEKKQVVKSAKTIETNSSTGYAVSFKVSSWENTKIKTDDEFDNKKMTVYVVKNNTLYSLSAKNKLKKLNSLKYISSSSNYTNNTNIGFSKWGDLVFISSSGVCFFNEEIDDTDEIQVLKDENKRSVQANYFTVSNGIVTSVVLTNGYTERLEDD